MSGDNWALEIDAEGIAWLTCDNQSGTTNVLSGPVVRELADKLTEIAARPVGVVASAKNGFIAGADINEFVKIRARGGL